MATFSLESPLAIVDVETTGGSPIRNGIIDIGIIRIEKGKVVERFQSLVDPGRSIPESIFALTGIREDDVRAAPSFNDISEEVKRLLHGAIFVAHNARFDYSFIKTEFAKLGIPFSSKRLSTVALSRALFPRYSRHDLSSIIERFDFKCDARHRALPDAEVLVDFLKYSEKFHGEETFKETVLRIVGRTRVPSGISSDLIDSLPETSGVYIFYGEGGDKLYIGKSINIRNRVMSHFSGEVGTGKEFRIAEEVRDIEAIPTSGELGALLLESYLIKKEQPLYNRMSRRSRKLVVVREEKIKDYKHADIGTYNTEDLEQGNNIIGIFRSLSQAKKILTDYSREFSLCPRMLGLEKGKGACFYSQIGTCSGACHGKEDPHIYNERFDKAFYERRIKAWPFKGAILIDEKDHNEKGKGTAFVVDEWRLKSSFVYDDDGGKTSFLSPEHCFDYDSYRILVRHIIENKANNIKEIGKEDLQDLLTQG